MNNNTLLKRYITEAMHGAGKDYLRKEAIKDVIQDALAERVASGEISDQAALDEFFATVDMAVRALRVIPLDVWRMTAGAALNKGTNARSKVRRV